jgi:hypothetical protein
MLPLIGTITNVDWGDGVTDSTNTHTYMFEESKIVEINVTGVFTSFTQFINYRINSATQYLTRCDFEDSNITNLDFAFFECKNLVRIYNIPTGVTTVKNMFMGVFIFTNEGVPIDFDTSKFEDENDIFHAHLLNPRLNYKR